MDDLTRACARTQRLCVFTHTSIGSGCVGTLMMTRERGFGSSDAGGTQLARLSGVRGAMSLLMDGAAFKTA